MMISPDREARPFADVARPPRLGPPVAIAAISAWILVIAFYALVFALAGAPIPTAIRGALANAIPDGILALVVFGAARTLDVPQAGAGRLLRAHAVRALLLVGLALAAKTLLLWLDVTLFRGSEPFRLVPSIIAWQIFVSALIYTASAAASHLVLIDRRLREEEARAARAEALRARAELSALRAQLNPHFLFNMLHSVLGMIRGDPALAEAALEGLGDLLRYALRVHRDGVDRTALRHEWEFMETYLGLEKIRLGDRLKIDRHADEAALDAWVPTFSLQPLVENAVRHGIAARAAGGRISVDARVEGDALRLEVSNDGDGRSAAAGDDEGGMGLRVLRDRLDVLYRGQAQMTTGPTAEGGYRVVLILPGAPDGAEAEA